MTEDGNGENPPSPEDLGDKLKKKREEKEKRDDVRRRSKPIPPVPSPGALNDLADRLGIDPNDLRKQGINIPERPTLPPPTPIDKKTSSQRETAKKAGHSTRQTYQTTKKINSKTALLDVVSTF